jgi:hypothetical protein
MPPHRLCQHPVVLKRIPNCGQLCFRWRQCPDFTCHTDIVYCSEHGGEARAEAEMATHILGHLADVAKV